MPVNASTGRVIWCHNGQAFTMPSGGMWAYWYIGVREGHMDVYGVATGVVPGGSVLYGWSQMHHWVLLESILLVISISQIPYSQFYLLHHY